MAQPIHHKPLTQHLEGTVEQKTPHDAVEARKGRRESAIFFWGGDAPLQAFKQRAENVRSNPNTTLVSDVNQNGSDTGFTVMPNKVPTLRDGREALPV